MRRAHDALLLAVLVLSLVAPLIHVVEAYDTYYVPITITNNVNRTLTDYQVKIVLDSQNFDGWGLLASTDGSDIYFLDESDNPIFFWIEEFDYIAKHAVIWVRVPIIPPNGSVTIKTVSYTHLTLPTN